MFKLRMKNEKEPANVKTGGKGFQTFKLISEAKDDSGLFEVLKEGQRTEMRDQCRSKKKRPRVKALVENLSLETAVSPPSPIPIPRKCYL